MAEETQVISCHNVDHWKTHFNAGQTSNKLIVVDFTATWCPPCRMMAPLFADVSKKFCNVVFLKVDVDELKDVAEEMGVEAMPTFLFFFAGKVVDKVVGAMKKEVLASKIEALLASVATASNTPTQTATT